MDQGLRLLRKGALTGGIDEKDRYIAALERVAGSPELPEVSLQGKGMNAGYRIMQALGDKCATASSLHKKLGRGMAGIRDHLARLYQVGAVGKHQSINGDNVWFATAKVVKAVRV